LPGSFEYRGHRARASVDQEESEAVRAVAYEEQQVWPAFRAALPADEASRLGAQLAAATHAGPTRPHPHRPPSPALLKTAGPVVAAADKLRDAASGRGN
jgi:hypothetical protein